MQNCTGIGGVGRETGIGNTITGEDRKMKGTTDWHPRLEKEKGSTVDFAGKTESTVDFTGKVDTRKDIRVCFCKTL